MPMTSDPPPPGKRPRTLQFWLRWLVVACIVPAALMAGFLIYESYRRERANAEREMVATARALMQAVDAEIAGIHAILQVFAASPHLRTGNLEAVRLLLEHGSDPNAAEAVEGQTALMWATAEGQLEVVDALPEAGADVNAKARTSELTKRSMRADFPSGGFSALMWAAREQMSEVQSKEGASIKHDISVPIAAIPRMIAEGVAAAEKAVPGIRPCSFGHMGDGNLHFNFSQPVGMDGKAFMALEPQVNAAVYEVVARLDGSISAEHGIGQLKAGLLTRVKDPVALEMMRAIKAALDPNGILNPGKVLVPLG